MEASISTSSRHKERAEHTGFGYLRGALHARTRNYSDAGAQGGLLLL